MCRFVRWLSSDSGLKDTAVSSMCRRGLPHQQTVKKSSVHFTGTLTTVLLLACSFLSNVPPPAPPPPGASSSGLLGPDERTATRARKCTACLLSPCSCSTSFTGTPVGKNVFPRKRRPVCLNQGGKVENFFFFCTVPIGCTDFPCCDKSFSTAVGWSPLGEFVLHVVRWQRISHASCVFYLVTRQHPALEPVHISSLGPSAAAICRVNAHYDPLSRVVARCGR